MPLTQYKDLAGVVHLSFNSINSDHTVYIDPYNTLSLSDIVFNNGKVFSFDKDEDGVIKDLNITPKRTGTITIPVEIAAAHTRRIKHTSIVLTVAEIPDQWVYSSNYFGSNNPTTPNTVSFFKVATIDVNSADHPLFDETCTFKNQSGSGTLAIIIRGPGGTLYLNTSLAPGATASVVLSNVGVYTLKIGCSTKYWWEAGDTSNTLRETWSTGKVVDVVLQRARFTLGSGVEYISGFRKLDNLYGPTLSQTFGFFDAVGCTLTADPSITFSPVGTISYTGQSASFDGEQFTVAATGLSYLSGSASLTWIGSMIPKALVDTSSTEQESSYNVAWTWGAP